MTELTEIMRQKNDMAFLNYLIEYEQRHIQKVILKLLIPDVLHHLIQTTHLTHFTFGLKILLLMNIIKEN